MYQGKEKKIKDEFNIKVHVLRIEMKWKGTFLTKSQPYKSGNSLTV